MTTPKSRKTSNSDEIVKTPPPPLSGKGRRPSLRNQADARRYLARVIGDLEADRIPEGRARVLIYGIQTLSTILDRHELEEELEATKKALAAAGYEVKP